METEKAVVLLKEQGYECELCEYASKHPPKADTVRVVAQKKTGANTVRLIVCGFMTKAEVPEKPDARE